MSKSKTFENDLLKLIFNGEPIEGLADNASAAPLEDLYLALHSADPGEEGLQNTSEIEYTGYTRVAVKRDGTGWTVAANVASPTEAVEFGEMTDGVPGIATHVTIGTAETGTGKVLYRGELTPPVNFNVGVVPRIRTTSTITEE